MGVVKGNVFLDSSILIAAVLSSTGGSFHILSTFRGRFSFQINNYVLEEVTRVLDQKFPTRQSLKHRLFLLLGLASVAILPDPPREAVAQATQWVNPEDAPILASALLHSSHLLTLDSDLLGASVRKFAQAKGLAIMKPKEFIEKHRE